MAERRKRPDQAKKNVPTRHSGDMDAQEREFWDLKDEVDSGDGETGDSEENADSLPKLPADDPADQDEVNEAPAGKPAKEPAAKASDSGEADTGDSEEGKAVAEVPVDKSEASSGKVSGSGSPKPNKKRTGSATSGGVEKISLITLGVLLLVVMVWGLSLFFKGIPTKPKTAEVEYPVAGKFVTVEEVSTYWRRPRRETDRGVKQDARIIPAALVRLGNSSGQGAIRVFFEDDSGKLIGDPSTLAISGGNFSETGNSEAEVYSTDGFEETGDHAAYNTGQIDTWHLIIKEGPDRNASGNKFQPLLRIPISTSRK